MHLRAIGAFSACVVLLAVGSQADLRAHEIDVRIRLAALDGKDQQPSPCGPTAS